MKSLLCVAPNTRLLIVAVLYFMLLAQFLSGCTTTLDNSGPPGSTGTADSGITAKTGSAQDLPPPIYANDLIPVAPQPDPGSLAPGLTVVYFRDFFKRHLDQLPTGDHARAVGRKGTAITDLNHAFGKNEVFDSGESRGIGMRINGLIHFQQTGQYLLQAYLNDGLRVYIDDRLVIDDPKWQRRGDRFSNLAFLDIQRVGWYPIRVEYFQRKGTATIKLLWQTPGSGDLRPIPPQAYAH